MWKVYLALALQSMLNQMYHDIYNQSGQGATLAGSEYRVCEANEGWKVLCTTYHSQCSGSKHFRLAACLI